MYGSIKSREYGVITRHADIVTQISFQIAATYPTRFINRFRQYSSHIVISCARELSAHFYSAAPLKYVLRHWATEVCTAQLKYYGQDSESLYNLGHIILTEGRPVRSSEKHRLLDKIHVYAHMSKRLFTVSIINVRCPIVVMVLRSSLFI